MIVVECSDKHSLVILHESKDDNSRTEGATDGESADESDTSVEELSRENQNRRQVVDDSSRVLSLVGNRIGVAKHDSEPCRWKVVTVDRGDNTGIYSTLAN